MIYVNKQQLNQVEYILQQSMLGHHVLFDNETLRNIFRTASDIEPKVEALVEKLLGEPTLEKKRTFLAKLDRQTYENVIRVYFNIVENNLYEKQRGALH